MTGAGCGIVLLPSTENIDIVIAMIIVIKNFFITVTNFEKMCYVKMLRRNI